MHDVNAAELELQKSLESEPENPEFGAVQSAVAHSALGDILFLGRNDRQGARHEYETAFDAGLRGLVSLQLASVDFLDGNIDQGLARIQDVLSTQPLYYQTTEVIVTESFFLHAYSKDPDSQQDALADLKAKLKTFFTKQATNSEMQYFGMKFGVTYNCHDWFIIQLPWHVKQAIRNGYPNPKFLRTLANVISQTAPATILEKFPEYHEHTRDTWNFPAR